MEWTLTFALSAPTPIEIESEIESETDDVTITAALNSQELVVRLQSASTEDEVTRQSLAKVTDLLNTIAWVHDAALRVRPTPLRTEQTGDSGARQVSLTVPLRASISRRIIIEKRDEQGNLIETCDSARPGKIEVQTSEAAAYFRRGKLSEDPFDRFRNFYLVAENIGDRIRLARGIGKLNEKPLLILALQESFATDQSSLLQTAQGVPGFQPTGSVFDDVARLLYKGFRCELNHAKTAKNHRIPFDPDDEREVQAISPLMEFVARTLLSYESRYLRTHP